MSNSSLVSYTKLSPNHSGKRNRKIDTISIHCMAGNLSVESCGALFAKSSAKASSNYGIGSDGRIALYVDEANRSWCTSSASNDHRAVTIEVANNGGAPDWPVSEAAYNALIELLVDICKRNGIKKLLWRGDKSLIGQVDKQNMTVHRWFANKACVPTYSEVLTPTGWVKISDIEIGDEIACCDLDNLRVTFEEVYDKVPVRTQDTYTNNELTATKDHRMVYSTHQSSYRKIDTYNKLLSSGNQIYIPIAGYAAFEGLSMSNEMLAFLTAVQADGHYMYERGKDGEKHYYGLEFHLAKQRKIERIVTLIEALNLDYRVCRQSNGTTKIRIYNQSDLNIVNDLCEKYLHRKCFTWEWLNLSPEQAAFFIAETMFWDGCVAGSRYDSKDRINLDIVNAIAAINGVGSRVIGDHVQFRETPYITLGEKTVRNNHKGRKTEVSCVSVKTGIFLMRQDGKTFIVGNCPGDYLYNHHGDIAERVNQKLLGTTVIQPPVVVPPATKPVETEDENMDVNRFTELFREMRKSLQDNDCGTWSKEARDWAVSSGLVQGGTPAADGTPNYLWEDFMTREQLVTVLFRFAQMMGKA